MRNVKVLFFPFFFSVLLEKRGQHQRDVFISSVYRCIVQQPSVVILEWKEAIFFPDERLHTDLRGWLVG